MTEILFKNSDGSVCFRDEKGQMRRKPAPPFYDGQYVQCSSKHYSKDTFTRVVEPTWSDVRGWIYGQEYVDRDGTGGGSGWWSEADRFLELTDPRDILIANRLELQADIKDAVQRKKAAEAELRHVEYALSLLPEKEKE